MNSREVLRAAADRLRRAGVPDPEYDSGMLLSRVTGEPWLALRMGLEGIPGPLDSEEFQRLLARRESREPLQYILGTAFFRGAEFETAPGVLIPRPETELLAEWAGEWLKQRSAPEVLDLCCGSGCIGLSLARELPSAGVTLTDLSPDALRIAARNRSRLGVKAEILQGDLFAPVRERRFDCVISNPPYIPAGECGRLQPEVMKEPRLALDGGADGLDFYRRIGREGPAFLKPGGRIFLETGEGEAQAAASLLEAGGALETTIRKDEAGIDRMVSGRYA